MRKFSFLFIISITILVACKKKPKCCCTNFSTDYTIEIIDSSKSIDTNFIKNNNTLKYFQYSDSVVILNLFANIDSTEDDKKIVTNNIIKISPTETDTIQTEIYGICGRTITSIWYKNELIYTSKFETQGRIVTIVK